MPSRPPPKKTFPGVKKNLVSEIFKKSIAKISTFYHYDNDPSGGN
jgi:hypothetical protein